MRELKLDQEFSADRTGTTRIRRFSHRTMRVPEQRARTRIEMMQKEEEAAPKIETSLASLKRPTAGLVVAELDEPAGCCAWAVVPTLQHGRVTLLLVAKEHRRRGIATAMLAAAEQTLAKAGCELVEVMSDIVINNAHNFFRSLRFEQTSYRSVRTIERS